MVMDVGRFSDPVREAMLVGTLPPLAVRPSHVQIRALMLALPRREHGNACWSVHCPCLFFSLVVSDHITLRREHGDRCWSLQ